MSRILIYIYICTTVRLVYAVHSRLIAFASVPLHSAIAHNQTSANRGRSAVLVFILSRHLIMNVNSSRPERYVDMIVCVHCAAVADCRSPMKSKLHSTRTYIIISRHGINQFSSGKKDTICFPWTFLYLPDCERCIDDDSDTIASEFHWAKREVLLSCVGAEFADYLICDWCAWCAISHDTYQNKTGEYILIYIYIDPMTCAQD